MTYIVSSGTLNLTKRHGSLLTFWRFTNRIIIIIIIIIKLKLTFLTEYWCICWLFIYSVVHMKVCNKCNNEASNSLHIIDFLWIVVVLM